MIALHMQYDIQYFVHVLCLHTCSVLSWPERIGFRGLECNSQALIMLYFVTNETTDMS